MSRLGRAWDLVSGFIRRSDAPTPRTPDVDAPVMSPARQADNTPDALARQRNEEYLRNTKEVPSGFLNDRGLPFMKRVPRTADDVADAAPAARADATATRVVDDAAPAASDIQFSKSQLRKLQAAGVTPDEAAAMAPQARANLLSPNAGGRAGGVMSFLNTLPSGLKWGLGALALGQATFVDTNLIGQSDGGIIAGLQKSLGTWGYSPWLGETPAYLEGKRSREEALRTAATADVASDRERQFQEQQRAIVEGRPINGGGEARSGADPAAANPTPGITYSFAMSQLSSAEYGRINNDTELRLMSAFDQAAGEDGVLQDGEKGNLRQNLDGLNLNQQVKTVVYRNFGLDN